MRKSAAQLLGEDDGVGGFADLDVHDVGGLSFAVTATGPLNREGLSLAVGIEVNVLAAIISAIEGADQELRFLRPEIAEEGIELEQGSVLADGTFFGLVNPKKLGGLGFSLWPPEGIHALHPRV